MKPNATDSVLKWPFEQCGVLQRSGMVADQMHFSDGENSPLPSPLRERSARFDENQPLSG
jgi:hypothetical protein